MNNEQKIETLNGMLRSNEWHISYHQKAIVLAKIDLSFDPQNTDYEYSLKHNIKELARYLNRKDVLQAELDNLTKSEKNVTPQIHVVSGENPNKTCAFYWK